tara:strand:- start:170 stop:370 length:201 start_codon:yes stop_codon:yes gene_type:complete
VDLVNVTQQVQLAHVELEVEVVNQVVHQVIHLMYHRYKKQELQTVVVAEVAEEYLVHLVLLVGLEL